MKKNKNKNKATKSDQTNQRRKNQSKSESGDGQIFINKQTHSTVVTSSYHPNVQHNASFTVVPNIIQNDNELSLNKPQLAVETLTNAAVTPETKVVKEKEKHELTNEVPSSTDLQETAPDSNQSFMPVFGLFSSASDSATMDNVPPSLGTASGGDISCRSKCPDLEMTTESSANDVSPDDVSATNDDENKEKSDIFELSYNMNMSESEKIGLRKHTQEDLRFRSEGHFTYQKAFPPSYFWRTPSRVNKNAMKMLNEGRHMRHLSVGTDSSTPMWNFII